MTPEQLSVIGPFALLGLFILTLVVAAWQPEHRCRWTEQCPHWRLDQARLAREAAARKARNDHFHS